MNKTKLLKVAICQRRRAQCDASLQCNASAVRIAMRREPTPAGLPVREPFKIQATARSMSSNCGESGERREELMFVA